MDVGNTFPPFWLLCCVAHVVPHHWLNLFPSGKPMNLIRRKDEMSILTSLCFERSREKKTKQQKTFCGQQAVVGLLYGFISASVASSHFYLSKYLIQQQKITQKVTYTDCLCIWSLVGIQIGLVIIGSVKSIERPMQDNPSYSHKVLCVGRSGGRALKNYLNSSCQTFYKP